MVCADGEGAGRGERQPREKITTASHRRNHRHCRYALWLDRDGARNRGGSGRRANRGDAKISFLSSTQAADIEAVAAQIIPTDDSPGAREAGVVYFIDRALATFLSQLAGDYRAQLAAFQAAYREQHPRAKSFAALTSEQQVEYLKGIEGTPFFNTTRLLTLLGMFSLPSYGGNHEVRNSPIYVGTGFPDNR
jgi:hypothetical protein